MERNLVSPKLPHFTAALISQSERWEYISLIIPFDDLRLLDRPFPLLRDLTFGPADDSEIEGMVFHDAPHLKTVDLGGMFYPTRVVLPWSQPTSITAVNIGPAVAAEILQQATARVTFICTLGVPGRHGPGVVPPRIHLESFILPHCRWEWTEKRLLDALTAPALQHLTISEYELDHAVPLTPFTSPKLSYYVPLCTRQIIVPKDAEYNSDDNTDGDEGSDDGQRLIFLLSLVQCQNLENKQPWPQELPHFLDSCANNALWILFTQDSDI
ncbi:hypothetical protein C8J57DRAFT_1240599 [Mycena rebaudengoi]|nr:hypothetical protein C8J57DRAFT_1240599 [Mycena rebaudengoi]